MPCRGSWAVVTLMFAESQDSVCASVMPRSRGQTEGVQDRGTTTVTLLKLAQLLVAVLIVVDATCKDSCKDERKWRLIQ